MVSYRNEKTFAEAPQLRPLSFSPEGFEEDPAEPMRALSETSDANFNMLADFLAPLGGGIRRIETFARLFGGFYVEADLLKADQLKIPHGLNDVPQVVLLAVALDGMGGEVFGVAAGVPATTDPWDTEFVYLASSRDGPFAVVII